MASSYTTVAATDWNEDGLIDLLVTTDFLGIFLFINSGSKQQYKFTTSTTISTGMTTGMGTGNFNRPSINVGDLNKDGKKDLICGHGMSSNIREHYVYFFNNIGTNSDPKFDKGIKLQREDGSYISNKQADIHVGIGDWNNDGNIDIFWTGYAGEGADQEYINVCLNTDPTSLVFSQKSANHAPIRICKRSNMSYACCTTQDLLIESFSLFNSKGKKIPLDNSINRAKTNISISFETIPIGVYYLLLNTNSTGFEKIKIIHTR